MGNTKKGSIYAQSWSKLKKDKAAMLGLFAIILAIFVSILGGNIRPDSSPYANDGIASIARLETGSTVKLLTIKKNKHVKEANFFTQLFFGGQEPTHSAIPIVDYRFKNDEIIVSLFSSNSSTSHTERYHIADVYYAIDKQQSPTFTSANTIQYTTIDQELRSIAVEELQNKIATENIIDKTFWLGTDVQGRDLLSRTMAGTIVSLSVGLISVIISLIIGVVLGALAGYYRGWIDDFIMWLINIVWSIPTLLLIISVTLLLGKGFTTVFFAVGLTMWVELARVVRGQILSIREKEYIEAGKALGFSNYRIITRHIFPNIIGSIIVISASNFAAAILIEAGLSFLGIGAQIPMVSWGTMIEQHKSFITHPDMAYLALIPGISIICLVFAFMLLGNGLRDSFDTRVD
ncbi:MAG: ABC transporter permease [Flavobacteriales bacterium]|jgi:peptide/nickel transport system permease protein|nr:ABC transporter permease [Flavobacteriales bacterium]